MEYVHALGISFGILSAFAIAVASFLFRRTGISLPPLTLNLYKCVIATIFLSIIFLINENLMTMIPQRAALLIFLSGAISVGLGDSFSFAALNRLGTKASFIFTEITAPVFTIALSILAVKEFISLEGWIGIIIVICGVFVAIGPPSSVNMRIIKNNKIGVYFAFAASICYATGGIMSKAAFCITDIDPLFSALIRITGGIAFLVFFIPISQKGLLPIIPLNRRIAINIAVASLVGTFGAVTFQQIAFKYTYTAVTQTLAATSFIFIIFLNMTKGIHPSKNATIGVILSIIGFGVLFYY